MNPTGSIKDRTAKVLIGTSYYFMPPLLPSFSAFILSLSAYTEDAERKGLIKKGDTLVEGTGGNTGIALAQIGRSKGSPHSRACQTHRLID